MTERRWFVSRTRSGSLLGHLNWRLDLLIFCRYTVDVHDRLHAVVCSWTGRLTMHAQTLCLFAEKHCRAGRRHFVSMVHVLSDSSIYFYSNKTDHDHYLCASAVPSALDASSTTRRHLRCTATCRPTIRSRRTSVNDWLGLIWRCSQLKVQLTVLLISKLISLLSFIMTRCQFNCASPSYRQRLIDKQWSTW
jgi:hypothetical protein